MSKLWHQVRTAACAVAVSAAGVGVAGSVPANAAAGHHDAITAQTGSRQVTAASAASYAYTLSNVNSGKCLEIGFGGKSDFNLANQYTCYGGPVQQWRFG